MMMAAAWNQQAIFGMDHHHHYNYYYTAEQNKYMKKRQVFLRSYQFCRKRSVGDRIRTSFIRVKRVLCFRLRSARKFRKLIWSRLRYGIYYKKRRFLRLFNSSSNSNISSSTIHPYDGLRLLPRSDSSLFSWPCSFW